MSEEPRKLVLLTGPSGSGLSTAGNALEDAGFGKPTRTSIFDYIGVPHHQRWMNGKKFDGGQLKPAEKELRSFYKRLLNFTLESSALMGEYREIHYFNKDQNPAYDHRIFSFVRWSSDEKVVVVSNFDEQKSYELDLLLPADLIAQWALKEGEYPLKEVLQAEENGLLRVGDSTAAIAIRLQPLESRIFVLQ